MRRINTLAAMPLPRRVLVVASLTLSACSSDRAVTPVPPAVRSATPGEALPLGQFQVLRLATYDGSGETVHPTYASPPSPWPASVHYLFITPYPRGSSADENPSLFSGLDGLTWATQPDTPNPLVRPSKKGYLSDPEAVYEPDRNEMYLYYREASDSNIIRLISSRDGTRWSAPAVVVTGANHTVVSPAVVRNGPGDWMMWSVNAGSRGCDADSTTIEVRRSADGVNWSGPQPVSLVQSGSWPWHLDVKWIPSLKEYWAIYNGKRAGDCVTNVLDLATSPDGVTWTTYPTPLLIAGVTPELQDIVYRSTFSFDAASDIITFWYSGARYDGSGYTWSTVTQRRTRREVFAQITRPVVAAMRSMPRRTPRLVDPP